VPRPKFSFAAALTLILVIVAGIFAACDDDDEGDVATSPNATVDQFASGDITVFAAASLTDAFTEIGEAFQDANPDANLTFNFGGSQDLRTQLEQGASADSFASADAKQMDMAVASGVAASESTIFAHNRLVVIVPKSNEAEIKALQDLATPGVKIVLANPDVPVGNYSRQFLEKASQDPTVGATYGDNVLANVVSEESNVRQVAAKVQLGEADAGIVYSSDVTAELAEHVTKIDIPDELNQIAAYPIALTADAANASAAQAFIDFVLSVEGQDILVAHGFLPA
jgi:molybdate transport system substrate-binding protein